MSTPTTLSIPCRLLQLCPSHVDSYNFVAPMSTPTTLSPMSTPTTSSIPCRLLQLCQSHVDNFVNPMSTPTAHVDTHNLVNPMSTPTTLSLPFRPLQLCRPCRLLQLCRPCPTSTEDTNLGRYSTALYKPKIPKACVEIFSVYPSFTSGRL